MLSHSKSQSVGSLVHSFQRLNAITSIVWLFRCLALLGVFWGASVQALELPFGEGLLWEVRRDGVEPSYVFGSLNSSQLNVVDSGAYARELISKSDYLLVDIVDDDSIKQKLFSSMLYRDNRRLDELVSPETFEKIKVLGYEYGYLARQMKVLKPWAAWVVFTFPPSEASRISLGIRTLNQTFQDLALAKGITIVSLETIEEQLAAIDGGNEADQLSFLDSLPSEIKLVEEKFQITANTYLAKSSQGLYELFLNDLSVLPPENAKLYLENYLTRRNHQMVVRMQETLSKGNGFVAIDALHLPGEEGILNLLREQGYEIKAVK